ALHPSLHVLFFFLRRSPPPSPLFPYTTLFRSTGSRGPRRPLRTRLLLPVSEHHGEIQHLRGDARLRLLPHGRPAGPGAAVPSLHAKGGNRWPRAEAADRAEKGLQENEKGTRSAPRCVHGPRHDSQVDFSDGVWLSGIFECTLRPHRRPAGDQRVRAAPPPPP